VPGFEPALQRAAPTLHSAAPTSQTAAPTSQPTEPAPRSSQNLAAPQGLDPNGGIKGRRKSRKDKLREAQTAPGHPL
jgi:ATP-dependent RNA helicase RhlE